MRIRFITTNPLQAKFLAIIFLSMMVPLFVVGGCLYYLMFQIMAEQLAIPESIAYNLIPVLHRMNFLILVGLPPIVVLLFIWGIIVTHRLMGPLERLEDEIRYAPSGYAGWFDRTGITLEDLERLYEVDLELLERSGELAGFVGDVAAVGTDRDWTEDLEKGIAEVREIFEGRRKSIEG